MPRRGIDLTEDQWALAKSRAAERRQTISQYFADLVGESNVKATLDGKVIYDGPSGEQATDAIISKVREAGGFQPFTPAPKPGKGTKR